jgi:hypothetical protein
MKNTGRKKDALPESFDSYEEAGEFWDTHSLTDYEEAWKPANVTVNLKRRRFEIEIDEESFKALRRRAIKQKKQLNDLASDILKKSLGA